MSFTARIEIQGLFRLVTDHQAQPKKLTAVAPWVLPGGETPPHQFAAYWYPFELGQSVPSSLRSVWWLPGQELSFTVGGGTPAPGELKVDLDDLRIPRLFAKRDGQNVVQQSGIFDPDKFGNYVKIRDDLITKKAGEFTEDTQAGGTGPRRNKEKVMGRVSLDRGEIVTDDTVSVASALEPSLWSGAYSDFFTNRIAVLIENAEFVRLDSHDLISGVSTGGVTLRPTVDEFRITILHVCPEFLLTRCPETVGDGEDSDFKELYEMSTDLAEVLKQVDQVNPGASLPVPKRDGDPHTCRQWECGCFLEHLPSP